jgi:hypothetical protein
MPRRVVVSLAVMLGIALVGLEVGRHAFPGKTEGAAGADAGAQDDSFYRVGWEGIELSSSLSAGRSVRALVSFHNAGTGTWPDMQMYREQRRPPVRVSYRWWRQDADLTVSRYTTRVDLPWPLRPGESVTLPVDVQPPAAPGRYRLQIDLVQEFVAWFEQRGADRLLVPVTVEPSR